MNYSINKICPNPFMNLVWKSKLIGLVIGLILSGCAGATDMPIPDKIGEKERFGIVSEKEATRMVNKLHGQSVAADANIIAEYGKGEKKDILYISRYADSTAAQEAYESMIEKMAATSKSPFHHLMPLQKYQKKAHMTLGMGAVHFIYHSGRFLLWLQTYQTFGTTLPPQLLASYPIK